MNQEAIHYIMQRMSGWLDNRQMVVLQNTLDESVKLTGDRETEKTTAAIEKGMPIEQVQRLLGHEKIDTTLHYAMVKQYNVKMSHKKYIG